MNSGGERKSVKSLIFSLLSCFIDRLENLRKDYRNRTTVLNYNTVNKSISEMVDLVASFVGIGCTL